MYKFEDLIEEVKEFNTDLRYGLDDIVGVTIEKGLIPTIANLTQTALDKFYIIKPETFVYNPRTHGVRLGMGYNDTCNTYITTWNNVAFRVKDTAKNIVIPQYLWLYFCRPVWDRLTNFLAWGSSTIVFAWKDFLTIEIDLPSITRQREIVAEYETLTRRIRINEKMIQNLESTAQTLYRKMFVDGIDKENLPEGWRMGTLGEICIVNPKLTINSKLLVPYIDMDSLPIKGFFMNKIQYKCFNSGMKFKNGDVLFARITPCMENGKAAIVTDLKENTIAFGSTEFIVLRGKYQKLTSILAILVRDEEFRTFAKTQMKGTDGRQRVDAISLLDYEMLIPEDKILRKIESDLSKLHYQMYLITKENFKLTELQSLLLAKMGQ